MNKWLKKGMAATVAGTMVFGLAACGSKGNGGSADGHLVFQIWDQGQKAGMEAMAEAYTKEHEGVTIEVQAVGWDEYWTKLEASATSNSMPDIFWMHSNQIYKYADNWDLINLCTTYGDMNGKWDVAMLPKCPNPANGDGRASISNSVSYATAAKGKNKELAMDFLEFLGSEEAQKIQGESGAAIPAYNGLEDAWVQSFADKGYELTLENLIGEFEYSVKYVNNPSRPSWEPKVEQTMLDIYAGSVTIDEGIEKMQSIVTEAMEE